jgi:hypothetical protein
MDARFVGEHPKVAQIVLIRDKGDKEDKGDKGDNSEKEKYICKNGMLPFVGRSHSSP